MIALWNHETGTMTTMSAKHDTYIAAKSDMERQASGLWNRRGRLMFPARLWLPLTRTPAVLLSRFAVGSAWCPFNFTMADNKQQIKTWEKALCLYLNSSVGILALLGIKDFKKMSYPNFSKDSIGKLPIPDLVICRQNKRRQWRRRLTDTPMTNFNRYAIWNFAMSAVKLIMPLPMRWVPSMRI